MKIVHIISGGDTGGAKTHIEALLPKLNKTDGVRVALLCVVDSVLADECRKMGIEVKIIPQRARYDLSSISKMARYINSGNFDIVHCHGARANFLALFLRFGVKKPMLTTIHSDYKLDFIGSWYKKMVYTPLNVISLKRFKHFITISEQFKQMLVARGFKPDSIDVIYHGLDFDKKMKIVDKNQFLSKFGIYVSDSTAVIGCVTRLHPTKGVDVLLRALKMLVENENPDIIVLIAGSGDEKQNLTSYVAKYNLADKVKFLGHVKDISSFYGAIDINVLPSMSEGFGLALVEGARFKLSTIASRAGGIPEIIKDGETGLLFDVGDYERLYELLLENLNDPEAGKRRGEIFYADALKRFTVDEMASRHIGVYNKLLGEKKDD